MEKKHHEMKSVIVLSPFLTDFSFPPNDRALTLMAVNEFLAISAQLAAASPEQPLCVPGLVDTASARLPPGPAGQAP